MDRPPPDPAKLLDAWMEWERGEAPPGRVMSNLKTAGLRQLLDDLVTGAATSSGAPADPAAEQVGRSAGPEESPVAPGSEAAQSWTPVV
jgi:hypothetical protein